MPTLKRNVWVEFPGHVDEVTKVNLGTTKTHMHRQVFARCVATEMTKRAHDGTTDDHDISWYSDADLAPGRVMGPHIQKMATFLTGLGCVVVPGKHQDKRPLKAWAGITQSARPDEFTTDQIGILTGPSQLCVIDVDVKGNGIRDWNKIVSVLDIKDFLRHEVPFEVTTTGGLHFYFKSPQIALQTKAKVYIRTAADSKRVASIDVRAAGGFIRCAPSFHVESSGEAKAQNITWITQPDKSGFPVLPAVLERILRGEDDVVEDLEGCIRIVPREAKKAAKRPRTARAAQASQAAQA